MTEQVIFIPHVQLGSSKQPHQKLAGHCKSEFPIEKKQQAQCLNNNLLYFFSPSISFIYLSLKTLNVGSHTEQHTTAVVSIYLFIVIIIEGIFGKVHWHRNAGFNDLIFCFMQACKPYNMLLVNIAIVQLYKKYDAFFKRNILPTSFFFSWNNNLKSSNMHFWY